MTSIDRSFIGESLKLSKQHSNVQQFPLCYKAIDIDGPKRTNITAQIKTDLIFNDSPFPIPTFPIHLINHFLCTLSSLLQENSHWIRI